MCRENEYAHVGKYEYEYSQKQLMQRHYIIKHHECTHMCKNKYIRGYDVFVDLHFIICVVFNYTAQYLARCSALFVCTLFLNECVRYCIKLHRIMLFV